MHLSVTYAAVPSLAGVAWHPAALLEMSAEGVNLATGAADNTARLWSREGSLLRTLDGHTDRSAPWAHCLMHGQGGKVARHEAA